MKFHKALTPERRTAIETELGFASPPYRLLSESVRSDIGFVSVGLHRVHLPKHLGVRLAKMASADAGPTLPTVQFYYQYDAIRSQHDNPSAHGGHRDRQAK